MRFICKTYLHLLEKARLGDILNTCLGNFVVFFRRHITNKNNYIKLNQSILFNSKISSLCRNQAKLPSVTDNIPPLTLQNTLRQSLYTTELSA